MNESLEYEKMIEIPSASCEYVHKRFRRVLKKRKLIKNVNAEIEKSRAAGETDGRLAENAYKCAACGNEFCENADSENIARDRADAFALNGESGCEFCDAADNREVFEDSFGEENARRGGRIKAFFKNLKNPEKRGDRIITAQIAAAFLLVVAIILTNVFWENSGMNTLFKSVFGVNEKQTDNRVYSDFSLNLPVRGEGLTYTEGVININNDSFVYPVCDGKVSKIEKSADGKYTVTIAHSDSFKSIIEGADFVCFEAGENVNSSVPLCHANKGAKIYLYGDNELLTGYAAEKESIVWNK